ncbi:MAG: hypothetical protein AAF411_03345, partial [Myxococcota bacterium]
MPGARRPRIVVAGDGFVGAGLTGDGAGRLDAARSSSRTRASAEAWARSARWACASAAVARVRVAPGPPGCPAARGPPASDESLDARRSRGRALRLEDPGPPGFGDLALDGSSHDSFGHPTSRGGPHPGSKARGEARSDHLGNHGS